MATGRSLVRAGAAHRGRRQPGDRPAKALSRRSAAVFRKYHDPPGRRTRRSLLVVLNRVRVPQRAQALAGAVGLDIAAPPQSRASCLRSRSSDVEPRRCEGSGDPSARGVEGQQQETDRRRDEDAWVLSRQLLRRVSAAEVAVDLNREDASLRRSPTGRLRAGPAPTAAWLLGIARNVLAMSRRRGTVEGRARRRLRSKPAHGSASGVIARIVDEEADGGIAADLSCSESVVRRRVSRGLVSRRPPCSCCRRKSPRAWTDRPSRTTSPRSRIRPGQSWPLHNGI